MRRLLLLNVFEPEAIGERIKQARERAGLRQEDLADILGVATRTLQNYEGATTKPFKQLNAIAAATGVTTEWLLHGDATREDADASGNAESIADRLEELAAGVAGLVRGQALIAAALGVQLDAHEQIPSQRSPSAARPRRKPA